MASGGTLILIIVFALLALGSMAGLSFYLGKKVKENDDWAVGGRNIPWYVIVGTQYATAVGGAFLVTHVGLGYSSGWFPILYGVLAGIGMLLIAIMAKWLREQGFSSVPDILKKIYGDNKLLIAIGAVSCMILPLAATCTQLVSFGKLFASITGMNINLLIIIFAIISGLMVLPAGLKSVAWTDFIFGCLMFVFTIIVSIFAVSKAGGWSSICASVPNLVKFSSIGLMGSRTLIYFSIVLITGTVTTQAYYQRVFAVDKVENARRTIYITVVAIVVVEIFAAILGMAIKTMNPELSSEAATGWFLTVIPTGLLVFYAAFIVVTIMSTVDSMIHSAAINVTRDFYHTIINPNADDKKLLNLNKIVCVGIVIFALILALAWKQALGWLLIGYSYSSVTLLVPLFGGYLLRNKKLLTPIGGVASMIGGIVGALLGQHVFHSPQFYSLYGFGLSFIVLIIVSLITREKKITTL